MLRNLFLNKPISVFKRKTRIVSWGVFSVTWVFGGQTLNHIANSLRDTGQVEQFLIQWKYFWTTPFVYRISTYTTKLEGDQSYRLLWEITHTVCRPPDFHSLAQPWDTGQVLFFRQNGYGWKIFQNNPLGVHYHKTRPKGRLFFVTCNVGASHLHLLLEKREVKKSRVLRTV